MDGCSGGKGQGSLEIGQGDPCRPAEVQCGAARGRPAPVAGVHAWFAEMISHCLDYATAAKQQGRPVVGILCEYTPRELILAAGGTPVCLCGGDLEMIRPAENELPGNLCPLIKSTYGYHAEKANPFLEMADMVIAETTCDGKKKMYELMSETREMVILELPQKPQAPEALAHWRAELNRLRARLEQRFNVVITDEKLRQAVTLMNRERRLRRELALLMESTAPPITGRQLLDCKSIISGIEADLEMYARAHDELRSANASGNAGRVRVLLTGVPMVHGAERVVDLIEEAGGVIVCMENCTGVKPIWEDVDEDAEDILQAIALKYLSLPCSVMTPNDGRIELLNELARIFAPDCVIDLAWHACLTYDVESWLIKRWAEGRDLPYLRISTDYSPSDSARITVRIEALLETVRSQRHAEEAAVR